MPPCYADLFREGSLGGGGRLAFRHSLDYASHHDICGSPCSLSVSAPSDEESWSWEGSVDKTFRPKQPGNRHRIARLKNEFYAYFESASKIRLEIPNRNETQGTCRVWIPQAASERPFPSLQRRPRVLDRAAS